MERPPGVPEVFDVRTVVYLRRGENPPELSEEDSTALHHAHLAHLAGLGRRGIIAANGPLRNQSDETIRGMSVWTVDVARWAVAAGRVAFPEQDAPVGERVGFEDL